MPRPKKSSGHGSEERVTCKQQAGDAHPGARTSAVADPATQQHSHQHQQTQRQRWHGHHPASTAWTTSSSGNHYACARGFLGTGRERALSLSALLSPKGKRRLAALPYLSLA